MMTAGKPTKFHTSNQQSDGNKILKRIEFEFLGQSFEFNLNPEEYQQTEPSRIALTQTKGGAWMDDFGSGIVKINFKGTTGFKDKQLTTNQSIFLKELQAKRDGDSIWANNEFERHMVGFYKFKQLRDMIREYYDKFVPGDVIASDKELTFHNYTDGEHWIVAPETFELFRSISRPLLYTYNISLWCLRTADTPTPVDDYGCVGKLNGLDATWESEY